jgi:DNA-binding MarR family transcriptional regulator
MSTINKQETIPMENMKISEFMLALDRVTKNTKRLIDIVLQKYGLRSTHASCFFRICEDEKGLSSTELSEACGVDKAFISRITSELVADGYIEKDPGSKGIIYKRKFILTEKGMTVYNNLKSTLASFTTKASEQISAEKLAIFDEVLNIIDRNTKNSLKGGNF